MVQVDLRGGGVASGAGGGACGGGGGGERAEVLETSQRIAEWFAARAACKPAARSGIRRGPAGTAKRPNAPIGGGPARCDGAAGIGRESGAGSARTLEAALFGGSAYGAAALRARARGRAGDGERARGGAGNESASSDSSANLKRLVSWAKDLGLDWRTVCCGARSAPRLMLESKLGLRGLESLKLTELDHRIRRGVFGVGIERLQAHVGRCCKTLIEHVRHIVYERARQGARRVRAYYIRLRVRDFRITEHYGRPNLIYASERQSVTMVTFVTALLAEIPG
ncbi:hypothetical protein B0H15DRAFT_803188 [Mycena belliarum]|uniref:Uncharacterized protein n=1 Tax=Mycena belliarum TaxID=1033014 RepID=A0AAD6XN54_9AGAR|nr:hypothetical protein B0H15DRAFT_803188 [Mycena belliae]